MKSYGDILLLACYEMGHQPLSLALPLAFLRRAGFDPVAIDTSVQPLEDAAIRSARLVAIAIPMHTATRLGVQLATRVRRVNPQAHIVFCGLYAHLNAELLLPNYGDSVLAGEYEQELVELAERLGAESGNGGLTTENTEVTKNDRDGRGGSGNSELSNMELVTRPPLTLPPDPLSIMERGGTATHPLAPSQEGEPDPSQAHVDSPVPLGRGIRETGNAKREQSTHTLAPSQEGENPRPVLAKLNFPTPDRSTLPDLSHYAHFRIGDSVVPAGYVEATRGCLHTCLHCPITPIYEGRFFIVPRNVVLADIRAQVAAGAKHITFGDPDFLNGPRHSLAILRAMHTEFPALTFDATIKIEHILYHRDLFPELKALGCAFIVSAVESFSDHVLAELMKGHTVAGIGEAFRITRAAGIVLRPSFVAFTPWTTPQDYVEMLRQVEQYGMIEQVDPVQYTIRLLIPPHSALLTEANHAAGWLGDLDTTAFTYRWAHPNPRMDDLHREVARLVEQAVAMGDSTPVIFEAIKQIAYAYAQLPLPMEGLEPLLSAPDIVPGLTESWFC